MSEVSGIRTDAVEHYLACMAAHDWDGLAATIAEEGLTRDGPFCDCVEGKQRYVDFLRGVISSLDGYQLQVQRVSHVSDRVSFVELSETFGVDGVATTYPECILFERNDNGLISHVSVFMKQPGARDRWRAVAPGDSAQHGGVSTQLATCHRLEQPGELVGVEELTVGTGRVAVHRDTSPSGGDAPGLATAPFEGHGA